MLKMLIVDSSDDFRYSLEELFCNSYQVMCCANGKDAAELLASWQPDINPGSSFAGSGRNLRSSFRTKIQCSP